MSAHWFIAPRSEWGDGEIVLPTDESHHALNVMRVQPPDVITITDGSGSVARCAVARTDGGRLVAEILEVAEHRAPKPRVVVYIGATKQGKADDTIEKLAELGVAEAWAYTSERTVARWDRAKATRLTERWGAIARSAAKQSRNPYALKAGAGLSFTELARRVAREPAAVVLWEEATLPLRTALITPADRVALVIGPEGGLTRDEAEALADSGGQLVSLGPMILRAENAPVVATAALLFHYGLIG